MNSIQLTSTIDRFIKEKSQLGIFASGGFDSSLLMYSLFRAYDYLKIDQVLKIYVVPRYSGNIEQAEKIITWLTQTYPHCKYTVEYPGDPTLHHSQHVISGIKEILVKDSTIKIFLGDTSIPTGLVDNAPARIKSNHPQIVQPFIDFDKTTTIRIADQFGILDKLSQITSTCTESTLLRCRECWQCKERAWAFKQTNFFDVGLM